MQSIEHKFEKIIERRLSMIRVANGYTRNQTQIILPDQQPDWTPADGTILVEAADVIDDVDNDRAGNPPAVGRILPVVVTLLLFPEDTDRHTDKQLLSNFYTDAVRSITAPVDWHTFCGLSFNATTTPISYSDGDENACSASFSVNCNYRVSETNPSEIRY